MTVSYTLKLTLFARPPVISFCQCYSLYPITLFTVADQAQLHTLIGISENSVTTSARILVKWTLSILFSIQSKVGVGILFTLLGLNVVEYHYIVPRLK